MCHRAVRLAVALPDADRLLLQQGSRVAGLFVIVSGTCLCEQSQDGVMQPQQYLRKGHCFGHELLSHPDPERRVASATVWPIEICEFMFLAAEEFEALLKSTNPEHQLFLETLNGLWATKRTKSRTRRPPETTKATTAKAASLPSLAKFGASKSQKGAFFAKASAPGAESSSCKPLPAQPLPEPNGPKALDA